MPFARTLLLFAGGLASMTATAQSMLCPAAPPGQLCETFHYHVALYRPDTRAFTEVYATQAFANAAACERARERQAGANEQVVAFFRDVKEQQYPADRFGSCHCDMTAQTGSSTYLGEQQRTHQLRMAEEIRLRVRERLLDHKVASDSEIVRGLYAQTPPPSPALASARVPPPAPTASSIAVATAGDLRATRVTDTMRPSVAALDLPLMTPGGRPPAEIPAVAATPAAERPPTEPAAPAAESAPIEETRVEAQPDAIETTPPVSESGDAGSREASDAGDDRSPQDIAESFVSYETQRIQNVLRASSAIAEEAVKTRIFETAMERIQLLSNLRALIEGSGKDSRLLAAVRTVLTEEDRVTLVARLFGGAIRSHWAPRDAADVVFEIAPAIVSAPERVLRDNSGAFSDEQKKHALYLVLARTQPTEDQRLWWSSLAEGFLR